jgi:hypothetical protein
VLDDIHHRSARHRGGYAEHQDAVGRFQRTEQGVELNLGLLCALLLGGCASTVTAPEQYSGFLADNSRLPPATFPTGQPVMG